MTPKLRITWPKETLDGFTEALTRARKKRESIAKQYGWKENRERYVPTPKAGDHGTLIYDTVNVGADFRDVERKKASLLFDTPDVSLLTDAPNTVVNPPPPAVPGMPVPPHRPLTMGTLVSWHQELLNGLLGPRHANVKPVLVAGLFDVLCPSGVGVFKVGYEARTVAVEQPVLDPLGQPMINPITGAPETQPFDLPVWESWFLSRISPMGLLVPANYKSTHHAKAPFLGYDYCVPASAARRMFGLGEAWKPQGSDATKPYFDGEDDRQYAADDPAVTVTYVEYMADAYAGAGETVHPDQIHVIVFVEKEVVKHEPHPDQEIDPQTARLTDDSITTYTIQTLLLRDYTDAAWVPSDCTVTGALTREVNKYREQLVQQRDGNQIIMGYDPTKIDPSAAGKILSAGGVKWVPLPPEAFANGSVNSAVQQLAQPTVGRDSYQGQAIIERDREQILGIGANQNGQSTDTRRTATELSLMQRNSDARFEQERQRVLECYLQIVRVFDRLILRYCDARNAALILGTERGQAWAQFKGALLGGYHYDLQVDSSKYLDVDAERRNWLQLYNLTAKDPNTRRVVVLKKLAAAWGLDPSEWVVDQLPEPKPDPPKVNLTLGLESFNPARPEFAISVEIARQVGIEISPEAIQLAQQQMQALPMVGRNTTTGEAPNDPIEATMGHMPAPASGVGRHPRAPTRPPVPQGPAEPADRLNQHQLDQTGGLPGPGPM